MSEETENYEPKTIGKMSGWKKLNIVQTKAPVSKNIEDVIEAVKPILADVGAVILQSDTSKKVDGKACVTSTIFFVDADTGEIVTQVSSDSAEKALAGLLLVPHGRKAAPPKAVAFAEGQIALKQLREYCSVHGIDIDDFCQTFFKVPARDMGLNAAIRIVNRFQEALALYKKMKAEQTPGAIS